MKLPDDIERPAPAEQPRWVELNRQWLAEQFAGLVKRIDADGADATVAAPPSAFVPALLHCARTFGLSSFERDLLLLLAGVQLDSRLREAVSARNPDRSPSVTFALALSLLPEPHWDALSSDSPLRYWRLVDAAPGMLLADALLCIDERILHFVAGIAGSDAQLTNVGTFLAPGSDRRPDRPEQIAPIARALTASDRSTVVVLHGGNSDPVAARDEALSVLSAIDRSAVWLAAHDVPTDPTAQTTLARHIDREAALTGLLPIFALGDGTAERAATGLAGRLHCPILWLGSACSGLSALPGHRRILRFELAAADAENSRARLLARWMSEPRKADGALIRSALGRAASQFHLGPIAVETMVERLSAVPAADCATAIWPIARECARGGLDALAQRIPTQASFDDLVLPDGHLAMLRDIARQLRHRNRVFQEWGFGAKHRLGQGLIALFAGDSGTGKTLAAEAIAEAAELDLYRIDLAMLVSKYIGETEKNLKSLFDAAETSGAVLLFDEADALFGKRSEVRDSHDRYANIEVAYLLQRIEAYRGLAILTTNMKSAIDPAFLRRFRFVINFPFPDAAARERIWKRQLPAEAPVGEVDLQALSQLNLSGANIRSVALNAAFKAADAERPIEQAALMAAARDEFAKLERSFNVPSEFGP